jgi:hypothetical protein
MAARMSKKAAGAKPKYKRTPREDAVLKKVQKGLAEQVPRMKRIKVGNRSTLMPDHPDGAVGLALLMEELGTTDADFLTGILSQLANSGPTGSEIDDEKLNFLLSLVRGIKPKDQIETMLAAHMAVVHSAIMTFARYFADAQNIEQLDPTERTFNKLTRTFVAQMEALKRYRTGGEQTVTVQHVNVGEGGQAIVGNVTQGQRDVPANVTAAPPLALSGAKTTPMPIIESKERAQVREPRSLKRK